MPATSLSPVVPSIRPSRSFDYERIDRIVEEYSDQKGAVLPILQSIQDLLGYLPRPVLQHISQKMLIPLNDLYGVATFYRRFRLSPCGRHSICVCDGTNCHLRGAERNIEAVQRALHLAPGETSIDGSFTFETVYCLGACAHGPIVLLDGVIQRHTSARALVDKIGLLH